MSWFDDNQIEHSGADMSGMTGTPPGAIAAADDASIIGGLASKYGIGAGETDLANLHGKNPEDRAAFIAALDAQYARRAAPSGGGGGSAPAQSASGGFSSGAPQSIQPFSFDPSSVGKSDAFKFRFDKALEAIKRVGVAKGSYFNPQTWKAAEDEASGLASQEFGNEFDRQFQTHDWNETNRYNSQRSNRLDDFGMFDTNRRFDRSVYQDDRNFGRGVFENDRNFDYGKTRDTMGDYWKFIDYGYPRSSGLQ